MTNNSIRKMLMKYGGMRIWQLCDELGISRNTYYNYAHHNFKGHQDEVKAAIKKLIREAGVKA